MARFVVFVLFTFKIASAKPLEVPLSASGWVDLSYQKIPKNQVRFEKGGLSVRVRNSASPLLYQFESPVEVSGFTVVASFSGTKNVEKTDFDEDSILRIGFVTLNFNPPSTFKLFFASEWLRQLSKLAPKNRGVENVHFYNVTNRSHLLGSSRTHSNKLMRESISMFHSNEGGFIFKANFSSLLEVGGLWVSVDGDDSHSTFTTTLREISIN